jgi:xylan 1,4-beta-xylosidase
VELTLAGLPAAAGSARLTHFRVDDAHSNPYGVWKAMGSPPAPSRGQYAQLEAASRLATLSDSPTSTVLNRGATSLTFTLPRQAVSLVVLNW